MPADDNNGRITLALLGQKLDQLIAEQKVYNNTQVALMKSVSENKQDLAVINVRMGENEKDIAELAKATNTAIDNLNNKFNLFSGANSFLGLVATALAVIFGVKQ